MATQAVNRPPRNFLIVAGIGLAVLLLAIIVPKLRSSGDDMRPATESNSLGGTTLQGGLPEAQIDTTGNPRNDRSSTGATELNDAGPRFDEQDPARGPGPQGSGTTDVDNR